MIIRTESELRQAMLLQSESEHIEFKEAKSDYDFDKLTDYCCALANEGGGSILLGVTDKMPRRIVGTTAFSNLDRAKKGLFDRLHIRIETVVFKTPEGRVLSFLVPSRPPGLPLHVDGRYLMRVGSSLTAMNPQQLTLLSGEIGDPRFLRFLEQVGDEKLKRFSTDDFVAIDLIHRDVPLPSHLKDRIKRLIAAGVIERTGRGKPILSRRLYSFLGESGAHTRKAGLDRETEKEFLLKHLKAASTDGAPMSELLQVLPGKSRDHIKRLLEQLRNEDRVHVTGTKRTSRWRLGIASSQPAGLGGE